MQPAGCWMLAVSGVWVLGKRRRPRRHRHSESRRVTAAAPSAMRTNIRRQQRRRTDNGIRHIHRFSASSGHRVDAEAWRPPKQGSAPKQGKPALARSVTATPAGAQWEPPEGAGGGVCALSKRSCRGAATGEMGGTRPETQEVAPSFLANAAGRGTQIRVKADRRKCESTHSAQPRRRPHPPTRRRRRPPPRLARGPLLSEQRSASELARHIVGANYRYVGSAHRVDPHNSRHGHMANDDHAIEGRPSMHPTSSSWALGSPVELFRHCRRPGPGRPAGGELVAVSARTVGSRARPGALPLGVGLDFRFCLCVCVLASWLPPISLCRRTLALPPPTRLFLLFSFFLFICMS